MSALYSAVLSEKRGRWGGGFLKRLLEIRPFFSPRRIQHKN
jgi:hypothetical protein